MFHLLGLRYNTIERDIPLTNGWRKEDGLRTIKSFLMNFPTFMMMHFKPQHKVTTSKSISIPESNLQFSK